MEIEIIKKSNIGFSPVIGDMTHELLSRLSEKVDSEGIDVLKKRDSRYTFKVY